MTDRGAAGDARTARPAHRRAWWSTTAPTMPAGSRKRMRHRLQDAVQEAIAFVPGTRSSRSAPAAPTPVFTPSARSSTSIPLPCARRAPGCWAQIPNCRPPSRCSGPARCAPDFHARHSALRRIYRYYILNRSARSALQRAAQRVDPPRRSMPRPCTLRRRHCSASMIFQPSVRSSANRRPA